MKYFIIFLFLLYTIALLAPVAPTHATKQKVAFIGSSSFDGGCNQNDGFIKLLQNHLSGTYEFHCKDTTKSGEGYTYFLNKWKDNVKGKGYNILVIYAGLNGLGSKKGLDSYKTNLSKIFSEAKNEGLKIIVMGAQPFKGYKSWTSTWGENVKKNNQWVSQQTIDTYIDVYTAVDKNNDDEIDPELTSDKLHLNKKGNEILYSLIAPYFGGKPIVPISSINAKTGVPLINEVELILNQPILKIAIPGVNFSDVTKVTDDDGTVYLQVPFLGEYISSVYKYLVIIAGIVAAVMLIFAGVQWMMPSMESQKQAMGRIQKAIIGLILVVTSYTILYTINPELVQFRNLRIKFIPGVTIDGVGFFSQNDYESLTGQKVLSPSVYDALAVAAAQKLGIDECIAKTILRIESGGRPNAIGYDENAANPRIRVGARRDFLMSGITMHGKTFTPPFTSPAQYDPKEHNPLKIKNDAKFDANSPPDYGLDFKRFGYGMGLGQIQVFNSSYCSAGVRGRKIGNTCYTIPELLTPEKNVEAMAAFMKSLLTHAEKFSLKDEMKIMAAFRAYNAGPGTINKNTSYDSLTGNSYVQKAMKNYKSCKASS